MVELRGERLSVGRGAPGNEPDLALGPDPQLWVSRLHCTLEFDAGAWYLTDNGTTNGTLVRRGEEEPELVQGRVRLESRDVILILGDMTEEGEPLYWRLTFSDPLETRRPEKVEAGRARPAVRMCLEYDRVQAKVYRRQGTERTEVVGLRPKAHQLISYMADKSRKSGGVPVACEHDELIWALWGKPEEWPKHSSYTRADLADVIADAREEIEPERGNPRLLETVRGFGYRLIMCEGKS